MICHIRQIIFHIWHNLAKYRLTRAKSCLIFTSKRQLIAMRGERMIVYTDLLAYVNDRKLRFEEFGLMVDPTGETNWRTFHKILRGTSIAGKVSGRKLDAFINDHRADIESVLGNLESFKK